MRSGWADNDEVVTAPSIPLADVAGAMLANLARATGSAAIAGLDGATLLGERATLMGLAIPGRASAGGSCRLIAACDGDIALNLARPSDRDLLPALLADGDVDPEDDAQIDARIAGCPALRLVARGRGMGLAIAAVADTVHRPEPIPDLPFTPGPVPARLRVLDLSALWAGPLAAHLLWLAGAEVTKVESITRPDAMRDGQPAFFDLLNQGKAGVALDLRSPHGRGALLELIAGADVVIEAARPRALLQLGIEADAIVASRPGLAWITITGHGTWGDAANWVGFGDDCGIAGGLGAAIAAVTGRAGFVGDAIADPLTGIRAASLGWRAWRSGRGGRHVLSMARIVVDAIAEARTTDSTGFDRALGAWAAAEGRPFPSAMRRPAGAARPFGGDPPLWANRC